MGKQSKLITIAIHTYEKAVILKTLLEKEGIETVLHNVNLIQPVISSGVRVRIHEEDLPLALKIIETTSILRQGNDIAAGSIVFIPVDFSDYSMRACAIGFDFASKAGGEVTLFHTFINRRYAGLLPLDSDEYEANPKEVRTRVEAEHAANDRMDKFKALLDKRIKEGTMPDVEYTTIVAEGVPEDEIISYSKEVNPSIIVMGTRGKSKKETDLMGSVTAEVLDAGKYPVFTVPENLAFTHVDDIKNVVFLSNLNRQDLMSLDVFAKLFSHSQLCVTIIPIVEKNSNEVANNLEVLANYCRDHYSDNDYNFKTKIIGEADFLDDFDAYIKQEKIDLIVIPNKKKNIFARLFRPSMAHKMLFHSDTAMLVVPV